MASKQIHQFNRRSLLQGATVVAGIIGLGKSAAAADAKAAGSGPLIVAGAGKAVVETASGKVSGFISNGIFTFKGIPYGASPAGAARFLPASKPAPWAGIQSCRDRKSHV